MKFSKDKQITQNFRINEYLDNRDKETPTHEHIVNLTLLSLKNQQFRDIICAEGKHGLTVTSGFRGVVWNSSKTVGGDKNSKHLKAEASDLQRRLLSNDKLDWGNYTADALFAIANHVGYSNITVYYFKGTKNICFVHVDIGTPWNDGYYGWKKYSDTMSCRILEV